ncbi:MAG: hypothetical protein A2675_02205 [Candidatus Yonathbacteria bacterium RIFCSPHIGHO2_01_FULL_51_10]|uniref:Uncharacterized protein n=1 Tax=Candidatus Yonathbacteria bacterium RIFCSPHIGHO2_01_FULL_51_10 TaxID=1802723 RepID=A0A1G2S8I3_9BACT|nr:MAG: hypothetical protein A2675_02205 [Candidatus Yonathbacteria bacterium RIFCSPHIGHO2_01_FULL_51_10]
MLLISITAKGREYREVDKNCMYFIKDSPAVFFRFGGKYWTHYTNATTLPEAESEMSKMEQQLLMEGVPEENIPRVLLETHQVVVPDSEKRDVQVKRDGTVIAPRGAKVTSPAGFSVWTGDEISCISPEKKKSRARGALVYENTGHF